MNNKLALDRMIFFSDAVFAIAITLLALNIKLPDYRSHLVSLTQALSTTIPELQNYVISFLIVGSYWLSHHYYFRYIKRYDAVLAWLNLCFLMCIVFLPFPTVVLDSYSQHKLAVAFYAASMAVTGLAKTLLWCYACWRRRLIHRNLREQSIQFLTYRVLIPPCIFLVSILIAFFNPLFAELSWLLIPVGLVLIR